MNIRYQNFIVLIALVALFINGCSEKKIDEPEITIDELRTSIEYLASDSLKGRFPGTPEDAQLSKFIAEQFDNAGLKLLYNNGLQDFDVTTDINAGPGNTFISEGFTGTLGENIEPFTFSGNNSLNADVVFVGYGFDIDTDSLKWNDYSSIDITGKWVLILRGDPELENMKSPFVPYSDERDKVMVAKDHGARGVLFVSGVNFDPKDELTDLRRRKSTVGIPVLHIKRDVADELLKKAGQTIKSLEESLNEERISIIIETGAKVKGSSEIIENKVTTGNVVAMLEGTDPELKDEYLVIGAHKDHLGMGGPNSGSRKPDTLAVHNGADDNASGTAAMLEIAEKLSWQGDSIRRSVIFVAFGAEEMGLLGSKYFVENPPVELSKIKAMINIDMVGRLKEDNTLQIGGTGTSDHGLEILKNLSGQEHLKLVFSPEGYGPSDHASFYGKDIPVFFISTGAHLDYHTPVDDIEMINFPGLKNLSNYTFNLAWALANTDETLVFTEAGPKHSTSRSGRRGKGVTLGIMPDFAGEIKTGLRADFVVKGKPADQGGMKNGDIIIAIEGKSVGNIYDYMFRLSKLKFGQTITVEVMRNGEKEVLLIQL